MELRNELWFKAARGPKLELTLPDKEGEPDKLTLGLKAAFNAKLAAELGVEWMFATETVAHSGLKDAKLNNDIAFTDCELKLRGDQGELDTFFPEKIYSFRVFAIGGAGFGIQCKVDITGDFNAILDFFRKHVADGFEFIIKSRQGVLFEGGTRVDLAEDKPEDVAPEGEIDRSYENKPAPTRGRGRPRKVVDIGATRDVSPAQAAEWDAYYDGKAESTSETADILDAVLNEG